MRDPSSGSSHDLQSTQGLKEQINQGLTWPCVLVGCIMYIECCITLENRVSKAVSEWHSGLFFCVSIIFHCILMVVPFLDCSVNIHLANRGYTERKGSGYCIPTCMAKTCVINLQFTKVHPSFIGSRVQRITLQILYDILTYPQPIHQGSPRFNHVPCVELLIFCSDCWPPNSQLAISFRATLNEASACSCGQWVIWTTRPRQDEPSRIKSSHHHQSSLIIIIINHYQLS